MSSAPRYIPHYTLADYQLWDGDWELWSGIPVSMSPSPFAPHQRLSAELVGVFREQLRAANIDCQVYADLDWIVSDDTVVRPDVMIVCDPQPQRHLEHPPVLVVEITSPTTAEKDRNSKYELYQQQKVPYYLIADPDARALDAYHLAPSGQYQLVHAGGHQYHFIIKGHKIKLHTGVTEWQSDRVTE